MLESRVGLFEVTSVERMEGYAHIKEVFSGDTYRITDIGISGDPVYDRFYTYTRVITYNGISFSTGLNMAFRKDDAFIKDFIKRNKKDYNPQREFFRFAELYKRFSKNPNSVRSVSR